MFSLSRAGYYADFVLMPALVVVLLAHRIGIAPLMLAATGFVLWTVIEYWLHRLVFHRVPLLRDEHDRHHAYPCALIGVSSIATFPLFIVLWLAAQAIFGGRIADYTVFGFVAGYLAYITIHYTFHHRPPRPGQLLYPAYHRHAVHHRGAELNFGVITQLWDIVFRTYRR